MRYRASLPLVAIAATIVVTDFASAQVVPENQPLIETRRQTYYRAPYRERTILRPWVETGESRDTPNENQNYYRQPGN